MNTRTPRSDFVTWLGHQLEALRARRFDRLDVDALGDELEGVVGKYRSEIRRRAERLIPILMRPYWVYGDWNDLRFERDVLFGALRDSAILFKTATSDIECAYEGARLDAELHGAGQWPEECPWKTLESLLVAVDRIDAEYLALERAGQLGLERTPKSAARKLGPEPKRSGGTASCVLARQSPPSP